MRLSLSRLAEALDCWNNAGRTTLTETGEVIAVNGLCASDAVELAGICREISWQVQIEDGAGGESRTDSLLPDYEPFRFVIAKSAEVAGPGRLVTNTALATILEHDRAAGIIRLVRCTIPFETATVRFSPFDDDRPFLPQPSAASPRRVVRESGDRRLVVEDLGDWILRSREELPRADECFQVWLRFAVPNVVRALANEVESASIVFRGPPLVRLPFVPAATRTMDDVDIKALQDAAAWVYDNERELEMRHGLYAAEMARTASGQVDAVQAFHHFASPALESARIAYGLNLSQVSRDTLKALADLRKAVSDEASKLADSTRTVAGAVAAALFAGVGLLITRSTTNAPGALLIALTIILALYVGAVVWSGKKFINVQAGIRANWRQRLYIFLPDNDYEAMVEKPARDAEGAFYTAAWFGAVISIFLILSVIAYVMLEPVMPPAPAAGGPSKPIQPSSAVTAPPVALSEGPSSAPASSDDAVVHGLKSPLSTTVPTGVNQQTVLPAGTSGGHFGGTVGDGEANPNGGAMTPSKTP